MGPVLEPAGGPDTGATPVAKTFCGRSWEAKVGVERLKDGLLDRGARVGVGRGAELMATSPKGEPPNR
eukprot:14356453-Heterocapsa_arctica.AAC.1